VDGTLCWADLSTPDQNSSAKFYSELFGWTITKGDEDPAHNYQHIKNGEQFIGGRHSARLGSKLKNPAALASVLQCLEL
jgi:predicted enzyme related to lactoylglutathione lyase